jgi:diguanylate cyclase (GGDEF)-like protein
MSGIYATGQGETPSGAKTSKDVTEALDEQVAAAFADPDFAFALLPSLGIAVISVDMRGCVRWLSPMVGELIGSSRIAEFIGLPIDRLFQAHEPASPPSQPGTSIPRPDRGLETGRLLTENGMMRSVRHTQTLVRDRNGIVIGTMILLQDVTEARLNELRLEHHATRDPLTGLLNRHAFADHLASVLLESKSKNRRFALAYMDLDQFKLVNDTCGHDAGDRMLQWVAATIRETLRENDIAARLGSDEFVILFDGYSQRRAIRAIRELAHRMREFRFGWLDKTFTVVASFGLVTESAGLASVEDLLGAAGHTCALAKERGRDHVQTYERDDVETTRHRDAMSWVASIKRNLQHERVRLFAQPIRSLGADDSWHRFEILFRMIDGTGAIKGPDAIIQTAEKYGLIATIDQWVVRNTLRVLSAQPKEFLTRLDHCSINLSSASLRTEALLDFIYRQFDQFAVPPRKICFEITETSAVQNVEQARWLMQELGTLGCRFALDDFGSGMASYSYLRDLPVDFVKIDRAFVRELATSTLDHAIVGSITQISHMLGIQTVAEGVESQAVEERLKLLGVDFAQGYFYSRPQLLTDLLAGGAG